MESILRQRPRPRIMQRQLVVADGGRVTVLKVGELKSMWVMEVARQRFKESNKFKVFRTRDKVCFLVKQIRRERASEALGGRGKGIVVIVSLFVIAVVLREASNRSPL
ncbi:hypothetical protein S83_031396 [Arachis hypogaea]